MTSITGTIVRITYNNPENGYSVLRVRPESGSGERMPGLDLEGLLTVVGNLPEIAVGERVQFSGEMSSHPKHGLQFKVNSIEKLLPDTQAGMEHYLGSGLIKGIGPELARRIVKHFKKDTLQVIENDPGRLREVPGIGRDRLEKIVQAWEGQRQVSRIMLFLHGHNISTNLAVKIYKAYGDRALDVVQENPYQLAQDIYGVGFKTADKIAQDLGLPAEHPSRLEAGLVYALNEAVGDGHVFLPREELIQASATLLSIDPTLLPEAVGRLVASNQVVLDDLLVNDEEGASPVPVVYLMAYFQAEKGVAERLWLLTEQKVQPRLKGLQLEADQLSREQLSALEKTVNSPVSVITGGPGTGKTTCLKALIQLLEGWGLRYALASPTGRAAKRLSEATGRPASTIHRLLGYSPVNGFQFYEKKPLNIHFLVVDETSMLDLLLAYQLLRALKPGTQVLFVGDVDQLPSVGAGDVLRDVIHSGAAAVSRLEMIYRQAEGSEIISNAHRINKGEMPEFSKSETGDFFMFPAENADKAAEWVVDLVTNRIPGTFGLDPVRDVQVLVPMYRGAAGVDALNTLLQATLNPPGNGKIEKKLAGQTFRVGDKVMQIRNNYDKDVYNGDLGTIKAINRIDQTLTVDVDGVRVVNYDFTEADELVLAYAVSVHKAQGSEFPAVVMPVLTQHYVMLQRNLIYTGITRAEKLCVLVGNNKALRIAVNNNKVAKRYSGLAGRLREGRNFSQL
ncbi:MAG: ATP-dependent RecD-like DNA helicase [Anaerolineaceae bacterium]|nr:ATP-dependent RecD-like DNA helicase [Anaerolineaceae bacterium]